MFTGIVADVGHIVQVRPLTGDANQGGVRICVQTRQLDLSTVMVGDSIAIQGACMTVVRLEGRRFEADVSRASLSLTVGLDCEGEVNLEKALRVGDPLGGHMVSGHVDGMGEVLRFTPVGESYELVVRAPSALSHYLAYKGSVTIDGVSLTLNRVEDVQDGTKIHINVIPHTQKVTTLGRLAAGMRVNIEIDMIARYIDRMMHAKVAAAA
jgi:riboflavin synthase